MNLDASTLALAMAGCPMSRAVIWQPAFQKAIDLIDLSTPARLADWIAQTGHESLGLLYGNEIWGPTTAQLRYERDTTRPWTATDPRNKLAFSLGNAQVGDGRRFAGHGPIQTTGRTNHAKARDELRELGMDNVPDFEADPQQAATPYWGTLASAMFWKRNNLNALSDVGDFETQTRRINGGLNGLDDRVARRVRARRALGLTS